MRFSSGTDGRQAGITALIRDSFTATEGPEEGALVADLAAGLLSTTPPDDLIVWTASDGDRLRAAILFSRMTYPDDDRRVFLLSPVAVAADGQRAGLGTALIRRGFDGLRDRGADLAVTYGSPDYYGRFGLNPVTTDHLPAPLPLSFPHGWLACPLTNRGARPFTGTPTVAPAMNRADVW